MYGTHTKEHIHQLGKIQRRAARMVCNDYRQETSASELIRGLDWDMLSTRRNFNRVNIMHKVLGGHLALPVSDYLRPASRNTRRSSSGKSFIQSSTRTNCHKYSFVPRIIKDWNSLPPDIQTIEDNTIFKQQITNYFRNQDSNIKD